MYIFLNFARVVNPNTSVHRNNGMKTHSTTGLYWFRHDLRLHDQPSLAKTAQQCDALILLYVIDPQWFKTNQFELVAMGAHRQQFLYESLVTLNDNLKANNQTLHVVVGDPVETVCSMIREHNISIFGFGNHQGFYERQQINSVVRKFDSLTIVSSHNASLFTPDSLPFSLDNMPDGFTPFRKQVEQRVMPESCVPAHYGFPPPPAIAQTDWQTLPLHHGAISAFQGGENAALKQLQYYLFDSDLISTYKETRNGLDGWDYSSKLSAWLANGCVSPRRVYQELKRYERERTENDSTYWLYFELLWREFFYWQQAKHGSKWFSQTGIKNTISHSACNTDIIKQWQAGQTDNAYVNACLRQLNATGYLSNRGRQWVASYFVNELAQDWRFGAAYFEQQLVDYDVGANWGNWQYLAGVGSDPRGQRQFNLAKQAQMYDPSRQFLRLWGERNAS